MRHDDGVANLRHYIEASVRHYARWHGRERAFLPRSAEKLEYPTENMGSSRIT